MDDPGGHEISQRHAFQKFVERRALQPPHQVESDKRVVRQLIASSVGQGQPFAAEPVAVAKHRQEAVVILPDPAGKKPVLLMVGRFGGVARPDKRLDDAVDPGDRHTRAVQLLLNYDSIMSIPLV